MPQTGVPFHGKTVLELPSYLAKSRHGIYYFRLTFRSGFTTKAQRPADFWFPMLGLFTGGRIAEFCQLNIADIQQHGGIWAISINSDGDKFFKSLAARRIIPVHHPLIDCSFLGYVKDARTHFINAGLPVFRAGRGRKWQAGNFLRMNNGPFWRHSFHRQCEEQIGEADGWSTITAQ